MNFFFVSAYVCFQYWTGYPSFVENATYDTSFIMYYTLFNEVVSSLVSCRNVHTPQQMSNIALHTSRSLSFLWQNFIATKILLTLEVTKSQNFSTTNHEYLWIFRDFYYFVQKQMGKGEHTHLILFNLYSAHENHDMKKITHSRCTVPLCTPYFNTWYRLIDTLML